MEPSKDVMELLDRLERYGVVEGFVLCEDDPDAGGWHPSDVTLSDMYQDWVQAQNTAREAQREAGDA